MCLSRLGMKYKMFSPFRRNPSANTQRWIRDKNLKYLLRSDRRIKKSWFCLTLLLAIELMNIQQRYNLLIADTILDEILTYWTGTRVLVSISRKSKQVFLWSRLSRCNSNTRVFRVRVPAYRKFVHFNQWRIHASPPAV